MACLRSLRKRYSVEISNKTKDTDGLFVPDGKDLLQIFWCQSKSGIDDNRNVSHEIIWQNESEIINQIVKAPVVTPVKKIGFIEMVDFINLNEYDINAENQFSWLDLGIADYPVKIGDEDDLDFSEVWDFYFHHKKEKLGGYPDWIQKVWSCCESPLYNILQTELWEGNWKLMLCPDCGKMHVRYQGT